MASKGNSEGADLRPDKQILIPATLVLIGIITCSILFTEASEKVLKAVYSVFTHTTGTWYLWVTVLMMILSVYLMCSRYGMIKFGEEDEKPEFSNYSWVAMMFCSGVAGAVMFWSIVEPLFNLAYPPQFAEPLSRQSFEWAMSYVLLHWGPVTWPWYVVTALPICYMFYKRKKPVLRISSAAEPVLGDKVNGPIGKGIEIFFIIGLMFSNAAVMGVSIPIVNHAAGKHPWYRAEFHFAADYSWHQCRDLHRICVPWSEERYQDPVRYQCDHRIVPGFLLLCGRSYRVYR